jgi:hypothetical protein
MFRKLAKFRPLDAWRIAPGARVAVHSNDNLPGFGQAAGRSRLHPNRGLACHWVLVGGRLECRWDVEAPDGAPVDKLETQSRANRAFGSPPAQPCSGDVTLRAAG